MDAYDNHPAIADLPTEDRAVFAMATDFAAERAEMVERGSFCAAVTNDAGRLCWSSPEFAELVGEPAASLDCQAIATRARGVGRASGLVVTPGRGSVMVQATRASDIVGWPLPKSARQALAAGAGRLLLVAFAPSRSPGLKLTSAKVLGLAPREADLAAALLEAPSLQAAADRTGMSIDTAKDTLARACGRAGVRGASELVAKLLDLSCGAMPAGGLDLATALGLTDAEARVAAAMAEGASIEDSAAALGLTPATVKSYRKSVFAKTGARRDRDLRRLVMEASRLDSLSQAAEIVLDDRVAGERLRVFARPGGRRVAMIDYGPASGRPALIMHGYTTGRRLPLNFVALLQRDGLRPVVIQRPGFGLTDPADDYAAVAADDMAATLDILAAERPVLLARDGGCAVALAFAQRHPHRLVKGVLLNPRSTRDQPSRSDSFVGALSRVLLSQPSVIGALGEIARQRSGSRGVKTMLQRLGNGLEGDRLMAQNPEVATHLIADVQGMLARTAQGLIDELRLHAEGWRVPATLPDGPWRVAWGGAMWSDAEAELWSNAGADVRKIDGMGLIPAYTHPAELAALLRD